MTAVQPHIQPREEISPQAVPAEKTSDRWLVRIAVLALGVMALALWNTYGTSIFFEAASGLWALCF